MSYITHNSTSTLNVESSVSNETLRNLRHSHSVAQAVEVNEQYESMKHEDEEKVVKGSNIKWAFYDPMLLLRDTAAEDAFSFRKVTKQYKFKDQDIKWLVRNTYPLSSKPMSAMVANVMNYYEVVTSHIIWTGFVELLGRQTIAYLLECGWRSKILSCLAIHQKLQSVSAAQDFVRKDAMDLLRALDTTKTRTDTVVILGRCAATIVCHTNGVIPDQAATRALDGAHSFSHLVERELVAMITAPLSIARPTITFYSNNFWCEREFGTLTIRERGVHALAQAAKHKCVLGPDLSNQLLSCFKQCWMEGSVEGKGSVCVGQPEQLFHAGLTTYQMPSSGSRADPTATMSYLAKVWKILQNANSWLTSSQTFKQSARTQPLDHYQMQLCMKYIASGSNVHAMWALCFCLLFHQVPLPQKGLSDIDFARTIVNIGQAVATAANAMLAWAMSIVGTSTAATPASVQPANAGTGSLLATKPIHLKDVCEKLQKHCEDCALGLADESTYASVILLCAIYAYAPWDLSVVGFHTSPYTLCGYLQGRKSRYWREEHVCGIAAVYRLLCSTRAPPLDTEDKRQLKEGILESLFTRSVRELAAEALTLIINNNISQPELLPDITGADIINISRMRSHKQKLQLFSAVLSASAGKDGVKKYIDICAQIPAVGAELFEADEATSTAAAEFMRNALQQGIDMTSPEQQNAVISTLLSFGEVDQIKKLKVLKAGLEGNKCFPISKEQLQKLFFIATSRESITANVRYLASEILATYSQCVVEMKFGTYEHRHRCVTDFEATAPLSDLAARWGRQEEESLYAQIIGVIDKLHQQLIGGETHHVQLPLLFASTERLMVLFQNAVTLNVYRMHTLLPVFSFVWTWTTRCCKMMPFSTEPNELEKCVEQFFVSFIGLLQVLVDHGEFDKQDKEMASLLENLAVPCPVITQLFQSVVESYIQRLQIDSGGSNYLPEPVSQALGELLNLASSEYIALKLLIQWMDRDISCKVHAALADCLLVKGKDLDKRRTPAMALELLCRAARQWTVDAVKRDTFLSYYALFDTAINAGGEPAMVSSATQLFCTAVEVCGPKSSLLYAGDVCSTVFDLLVRSLLFTFDAAVVTATKLAIYTSLHVFMPKASASFDFDQLNRRIIADIASSSDRLSNACILFVLKLIQCRPNSGNASLRDAAGLKFIACSSTSSLFKPLLDLVCMLAETASEVTKFSESVYQRTYDLLFVSLSVHDLKKCRALVQSGLNLELPDSEKHIQWGIALHQESLLQDLNGATNRVVILRAYYEYVRRCSLRYPSRAFRPTFKAVYQTCYLPNAVVLERFRELIDLGCANLLQYEPAMNFVARKIEDGEFKDDIIINILAHGKLAQTVRFPDSVIRKLKYVCKHTRFRGRERKPDIFHICLNLLALQAHNCGVMPGSDTVAQLFSLWNKNQLRKDDFEGFFMLMRKVSAQTLPKTIRVSQLFELYEKAGDQLYLDKILQIFNPLMLPALSTEEATVVQILCASRHFHSSVCVRRWAQVSAAMIAVDRLLQHNPVMTQVKFTRLITSAARKMVSSAINVQQQCTTHMRCYTTEDVQELDQMICAALRVYKNYSPLWKDISELVQIMEQYLRAFNAVQLSHVADLLKSNVMKDVILRVHAAESTLTFRCYIAYLRRQSYSGEVSSCSFDALEQLHGHPELSAMTPATFLKIPMWKEQGLVSRASIESAIQACKSLFESGRDDTIPEAFVVALSSWLMEFGGYTVRGFWQSTLNLPSVDAIRLRKDMLCRGLGESSDTSISDELKVWFDQAVFALPMGMELCQVKCFICAGTWRDDMEGLKFLFVGAPANSALDSALLLYCGVDHDTSHGYIVEILDDYPICSAECLLSDTASLQARLIKECTTYADRAKLLIAALYCDIVKCVAVDGDDFTADSIHVPLQNTMLRLAGEAADLDSRLHSVVVALLYLHNTVASLSTTSILRVGHFINFIDAIATHEDCFSCSIPAESIQSVLQDVCKRVFWRKSGFDEQWRIVLHEFVVSMTKSFADALISVDRASAAQLRDVYNFLLSKCKWDDLDLAAKDMELVKQVVETFVRCMNEMSVRKYVPYFSTTLRLWEKDLHVYHHFVRTIEVLVQLPCKSFRALLDAAEKGQDMSFAWSRRIATLLSAFDFGWTTFQLRAFAAAIKLDQASPGWSEDELLILVSALDQVLQYRVPSEMVATSLLPKLHSSSKGTHLTVVHEWCVDQTFGAVYELNTREVVDEFCIKNPTMTGARRWDVLLSAINARVSTDESKSTAIPVQLGELSHIFAHSWVDTDWIFVLSVMSRAVNKAFGHFLRETQLIAIAEMLHSIGEHSCKRRLLEMATSQGKSVVIAVVAAIHALCDRPVDICVSSAAFATRDCEHFRHFYLHFELKCATNNETSSLEVAGPKDCYRKDINIVYGTTAQFCFDILRDEFKLLGTKTLRPETKVLLIDEADNALLDEASSIARLAEPIPGFDYLSPIFLLIWHELQKLLGHLRQPAAPTTDCSPEEETNLLKWREMLCKIDVSAEERSQVLYLDAKLDDEVVNFVILWIRELLFGPSPDSHLQEENQFQPEHKTVLIPLHLHAFVKHMIPTWVKSAVTVAASAVSKDREYTYVPSPEGDGGFSVAPIDLHSTGVTHKNTQWTNGLHRFVELKDAPCNVKFNPEGLTTNFLPTVHYVNRYEYVSGITATVGGDSVVQLMRSLYGETVEEEENKIGAELGEKVVQLAVTRVPSYCRKQCWSYANEFLDTRAQWLEVIAERAIREANFSRVVLIVMQTVDESKMLFKRLENDSRLDLSRTSLIQYNESHVASALEESQDMLPNKIIVATALAGRALDIKLHAVVVRHGGLHLIMTYPPANSRVLEQVLGRTSRKGSPGSVQIILNVSQIPDFSSLGFSGLMQQHDEEEEEKCSRFLQNEKPFLDTQNKLFKEEFCALKKEVKLALEGNAQLAFSDHQLKSKYIDLSGDALVEKWAIWLSTQLPRGATGELAQQAFTDFKNDMIVLTNDLKLLNSNPAYALQFVNFAIDHFEQSDLILLATVALVKKIAYRRKVFQKCLTICEAIKDPLYTGQAKVIMSFLHLRLDPARNKVKAMTLLKEAKVALLDGFSICSSMLVLTKAIQHIDRSDSDDDDPTSRANQHFFQDAQQTQLMIRIQALKLYYECAGKFYDEINKTRKLVSFEQNIEEVESRGKKNNRGRLLKAAKRAGVRLTSTIITDFSPVVSNDVGHARGIEDAVASHRPTLYPLTEAALAVPAIGAGKTISLYFHNLRWDYDMFAEIRNDHRVLVGAVAKLCIPQSNDPAKHTLSMEFANVAKDQAKSHLSTILKLCGDNIGTCVHLLKMITSDASSEANFAWVKYSSLEAGTSAVNALPIKTYPSVDFRVVFNCVPEGCDALLKVCAKLYNCIDEVKIGVHALSAQTAKTLLNKLVDSRRLIDEQIGKMCNYSLYTQFETREEQLEVGYLHRNGFCHVYSMTEKCPFKTWTMITIGSIAAAEVLVSAALLCLGPQSVFFASVSMGLLVEAGLDIYAICKAGIYREHIWSQYLMQKAVSLGIIGGSASLSAYIAAKRAAVTATNRVVARGVIRRAAAQQSLLSSEFYRQTMTLAVPAFTRDLERCAGVLVERARFFGWQRKLQIEVHEQLTGAFTDRWNAGLHSFGAFCAIRHIDDPVDYLRPFINDAASLTIYKQNTTFRRAENYLVSGNVEEIVGKVITDYIFHLEQIVTKYNNDVSLYKLYPDEMLVKDYLLLSANPWVDTASGKLRRPQPGQSGIFAVSEDNWATSPPGFKELCFSLHEHLFPANEILHRHKHIISCVKSRMVLALTDAIVSHIKETIKMGVGLVRAVVNVSAGVSGYGRGLATAHDLLCGQCTLADIHKLYKLGFSQISLLLSTRDVGYVPYSSQRDVHPHLIIQRGRLPPNLWETIQDMSDLLAATIARFLRNPILGTGSELGIIFAGELSRYLAIHQQRVDRLRADFVHFGLHENMPHFERFEIEEQFLAFASRDAIWDLLQAFGTSFRNVHSSIQTILEELFVAIVVTNAATLFLVPLLRNVLWKYLTLWGVVLQVLPLLTLEKGLFSIPCSLLASDRFVACVRRHVRILVRGHASQVESAVREILTCRYRQGEKITVAGALQEWLDRMDSRFLGKGYMTILRAFQIDAKAPYDWDEKCRFSFAVLPRWWWRITYKLLLQAVAPLLLRILRPLLQQPQLLARYCKILMQKRTVDIALLVPTVLCITCDGLTLPGALDDVHENIYRIGCLIPKKNFPSWLYPFRRFLSAMLARSCQATICFLAYIVKILSQWMNVVSLHALDSRHELIHLLEAGEGFVRKFPLLLKYAPSFRSSLMHVVMAVVLWRLDFYPSINTMLNVSWIKERFNNWKAKIVLIVAICLMYCCACRLYNNMSYLIFVGFYSIIGPACWVLCSASCHVDLVWLQTGVITLINDDPVLVAVFLGILTAHWRLQLWIVSAVLSILILFGLIGAFEAGPTLVQVRQLPTIVQTKGTWRLQKKRTLSFLAALKVEGMRKRYLLPLIDIEAPSPARKRSDIIDRLVFNCQLRCFLENHGARSMSEGEINALRSMLLNVFMPISGMDEATELVQQFVKRLALGIETTAFDLVHALGSSPTCVDYLSTIGINFPSTSCERYFSCTQVCEIIYTNACTPENIMQHLKILQFAIEVAHVARAGRDCTSRGEKYQRIKEIFDEVLSRCQDLELTPLAKDKIKNSFEHKRQPV